MLQLPCLRLGLKGGNSNIIQKKVYALQSACILPGSVCIMQTDIYLLVCSLLTE